MERNLVYFDLETKRTANDAGGWDKKRDMGMSIGVTYSTALQEYRIYSEQRVDDLVDQLMKADLVIGYNLINFDYEVLMGYTIMDLKYHVPTLDLMVEVEKSVEKRLPLDSLAQATLGVGKIADGLDAIRWYRDGRFRDIAEYCCFDVKVTRLIHEYGWEKKELFYVDRSQQKQRIPIDWEDHAPS